jgi:hypothetical protein
MDKDHVGAGRFIGARPLQRFVLAQPRAQRFGTRHD